MPMASTEKASITNTETNAEQSDESNCIICLDRVRCRGKLSVCNHWFCYHCIYEWSKNTNTCPVCKGRFRCITKTHLSPLKSPPTKTRVPDRNQRVWNDDEAVAEEDILYDIQIDMYQDLDDDYEPPINIANPWSMATQNRQRRGRRRSHEDDDYDLEDSFIDDSDLPHNSHSRARQILLEDATYLDSDDEEHPVVPRDSPYRLRRNRQRGAGAGNFVRTNVEISLVELEAADQGGYIISSDDSCSSEEEERSNESGDSFIVDDEDMVEWEAPEERHTSRQTRNTRQRSTVSRITRQSSRALRDQPRVTNRPRRVPPSQRAMTSPESQTSRGGVGRRNRGRQQDPRRVERSLHNQEVERSMAETGTSGWISSSRRVGVRAAARSASQAIAAINDEQENETREPTRRLSGRTAARTAAQAIAALNNEERDQGLWSPSSRCTLTFGARNLQAIVDEQSSDERTFESSRPTRTRVGSARPSTSVSSGTFDQQAGPSRENTKRKEKCKGVGNKKRRRRTSERGRTFRSTLAATNTTQTDAGGDASDDASSDDESEYGDGAAVIIHEDQMRRANTREPRRASKTGSKYVILSDEDDEDEVPHTVGNESQPSSSPNQGSSALLSGSDERGNTPSSMSCERSFRGSSIEQSSRARPEEGKGKRRRTDASPKTKAHKRSRRDTDDSDLELTFSTEGKSPLRSTRTGRKGRQMSMEQCAERRGTRSAKVNQRQKKESSRSVRNNNRDDENSDEYDLTDTDGSVVCNPGSRGDNDSNENCLMKAFPGFDRNATSCTSILKTQSAGNTSDNSSNFSSSGPCTSRVRKSDEIAKEREDPFKDIDFSDEDNIDEHAEVIAPTPGVKTKRSFFTRRQHKPVSCSFDEPTEALLRVSSQQSRPGKYYSQLGNTGKEPRTANKTSTLSPFGGRKPLEDLNMHGAQSSAPQGHKRAHATVIHKPKTRRRIICCEEDSE